MSAVATVGDHIFHRLTDVAPFERVVIRLHSGHPLAGLLMACFDQRLVAVPLPPRTSDADMIAIVDRVSAAAVVDDPGDGPQIRVKTVPEGNRQAQNLAYIIFTSGSTGEPKGVCLGRDAVLGNAAKVAEIHGFSPERPHGTCLPLFHVNALVMSLHGTHLTRTPLTISSSADPHLYFETLDAAGARTASVVPAVLHSILRDPPPWPADLDYLITAAAPLSQAAASRFVRLYGPRLRQGYGLSEAVNFSFTMPWLDEPAFDEHYVRQQPPVGLPLPGTQFRLRDGEVQLRSPDLMSGYWQDEAATAEAFTPDRWLCSGDTGVMRDGFLVLTGRLREVINRGGEKFAPLDLERQWASQDIGAGTVAVPVEHEALGQEIGAVLAPGVDAVEQLRRLDALPSLRPVTVTSDGYLTTATGKPRRLAMGRRLASLAEDARRYQQLFAYARSSAQAILDSPVRPTCAIGRHVHKEAESLLASEPDGNSRLVPRSAAHDALDALVEDWPRIAAGERDGPAMMRERPGSWKRLMTEWPMGAYATLLSRVLMNGNFLAGRVLEIGMGVGNTTSLVASQVSGEFFFSDRESELVARGGWPGAGLVFDFDGVPPAEAQQMNTIFGTNALHCARDKSAAMRRLHELLVPGGRLLLSEGAPRVNGRPWALNLLFAAFDGWWDRGGFLSRDRWLSLFQEAGFTAPGFSALRDGRHDFGGVVWAVRDPGASPARLGC